MTLPPKRPVGRPPVKPNVHDEAAVEALCGALVQGLSMVNACLLPQCPSSTDVYTRMAKDEQFRSVIARARELQQEAIIDSTVDMADQATEDDWQVVKLRIWARQWRAGKLAPKKYGDKVGVEHSGSLTLEQLVLQSMKKEPPE